MSIKKDKKMVSLIMLMTGILLFVLVIGIVIFSLPNTKEQEKYDETISLIPSSEEETKGTQESETESLTEAATETTPVPEETTEEETTTAEEVTEAPTTEEPTTEEPTTEANNQVKLVAFGDNLLHKPVFDWAATDNGSYRLDDAYKGIAALVKSADVSIVNEEVPIGGIELGLHDFPKLNAPFELADTLHDLGIDVVTTATNHVLDMGPSGVVNMLTYFREKFPEMLITGTYLSTEERNQTPVYEVNGIKIAMLNYTYGINMGDESGVVVNKLGDGVALTADVRQARKLADFVIVFVHWGTEYQHQEDVVQQNWAQGIANAGADLIIGTHPHVVQPCREITAADGRKVICYYSLGNLLSLQHRANTMLGGIAEITLTKDENGTYISDYDYDFTVTQWDNIHNHCRAILWKDYTEKLAAEHGMIEIDSNFSYDALATIVEACRLNK